MSASLALVNLPDVLRMSSREIASCAGKRHADVLEDVRVMLCELYPKPGIDPDDFSRIEKAAANSLQDLTDLSIIAAKGVTISYDNLGNMAEIFLPRRECLVLATGWSIWHRARLIDRWAELEKQEARRNVQPAPRFDTPRTFLEALKLCVTIEEKNQALLVENEELVPKAALADRLCDAEGLSLSMEAQRRL